MGTKVYVNRMHWEHFNEMNNLRFGSLVLEYLIGTVQCTFVSMSFQSLQNKIIMCYLQTEQIYHIFFFFFTKDRIFLPIYIWWSTSHKVLKVANAKTDLLSNPTHRAEQKCHVQLILIEHTKEELSWKLTFII